MPLFDFVCRACQAEFEALVRTGHVVTCPRCGSTELDRQLPSFAVKSQDRTQAAAAAARKQHAIEGARDSRGREREAEKDRKVEP